MNGKTYKKKKRKTLKLFKILLPVLAIICILVIAILCLRQDKPSEQKEETQENASVQVEAMTETSINLGSGLRITDVGKYTGIYMEDGSDELVSGIMMITVKNEGEDAIQYAEITMPVGDKEAFFSLSTLTPGSTMILLEQNRMEYTAGEYTTALAENVVIFQEPLRLCEDKLKIQILDGALNVSNISGEDMDGDITIYYKNSAADAFYGGITYRVRIEDGLKKDEIRQVMAGHLSESGSTVMFVTCGDNE